MAEDEDAHDTERAWAEDEDAPDTRSTSPVVERRSDALLGFTVGAKVWHIPFKLDARVMQLAAAGDFMNKGKVLIEWEKVEKKKKSKVQRWCNPTDLELVRTSPRKAARIRPWRRRRARHQ